MKKILLGTLAVLTLAACSKDEVIQQNPNDEISFTVTANKAVSRAQDGYCNKSLPTSFNVWANVSDGSTGYKPYFSGDEFIKDETNTYKNKDINRYWPSVAVNFFACVNATPEWKSTTTPTDYSTIIVKDFTVQKDLDKQVDFIYATVKGATKPAADAVDKTQKINFRHALTQIEFMAKNENSKIYVEISSVSVMNVYNKGTFTFPTESTKDNYEGPKASVNPDSKPHTGPATPTGGVIVNQGKWDVNTSSTDDYTASFTAIEVPYNTNPSLTVTDPTNQEWNTNTMYLMPYGDASATPAEYIPNWNGTGIPAADKAYFQITAKIWNVAATTDATPGSVNKTTDVVLYDGEIAVKIPDNTVWEQGKRYVYTFKFIEKGNGGTNPGTGDPVLVPITINVTIDDFVDGTGAVIPMSKP